MRKFFTFYIAVLLSLNLCACTSTIGTGAATTTTTATATTTVMATTTTIVKKTTTKKPATTTLKTTTTTTKKPTTTTSLETEEIPVTTIDYFVIEQENFRQLYAAASTQYLNEIENEIEECQKEWNEWHDLCSSYSYQQYLDEMILRENYANMGLLNSGSYQNALNNLHQKYRSVLEECHKNMNTLSEFIEQLNEEKYNPDPIEILAIVAYNERWSAEETIDKYYKYMP